MRLISLAQMFRQAISLRSLFTDNGSNVVDVLLIDATAATALSGGPVDALVNGDLKYADNGYTTLNTVLGQAGHAGIAVEMGTNNGALMLRIKSI